MPLKTTNNGNPAFVIGDPMKKVHMGKNNLFIVMLALKSFCPLPMCFDNGYEKC
jgi:uncharacterized secreted protein with C-terminal beta-propeller domain